MFFGLRGGEEGFLWSSQLGKQALPFRDFSCLSWTVSPCLSLQESQDDHRKGTKGTKWCKEMGACLLFFLFLLARLPLGMVLDLVLLSGFDHHERYQDHGKER